MLILRRPRIGSETFLVASIFAEFLAVRSAGGYWAGPNRW